MDQQAAIVQVVHLVKKPQVRVGQSSDELGRRSIGRESRFHLAVEYLRNHLDKPELVKRLREHLQISEASLKRLFHGCAAKSPRAYALGEKMQWAQRQLSSGECSVKAVAYALGYKHANDFSRAFKRHKGFQASRLQGRTRAHDSTGPLAEKPPYSVGQHGGR